VPWYKSHAYLSLYVLRLEIAFLSMLLSHSEFGLDTFASLQDRFPNGTSTRLAYNGYIANAYKEWHELSHPVAALWYWSLMDRGQRCKVANE